MVERAASPHAERFTTPSLGGVTLHAVHRGDRSRPTLILLHGGGANGHWWDHLAGALAEEFHVVALDFRGHGDSDYPAALEVGAFDRDLEALLEYLGRPWPILVGHSMGGHVALQHAAHRGGVRALVCIEVSRGAPKRERRRARLAFAARRTYRSPEEAIRRFQFFPAAPHASEALRLHIARHSLREEAGRFGYKFDARWFSLPSRAPAPLTRIDCPTLLVRGGESTLLTAAGAAGLVAEIQGAHLVEIPECGHNVHLERPHEVLDAIRRFLNGTS